MTVRITTLEVVIHSHPDSYTVEDIENMIKGLSEEDDFEVYMADVEESHITTMEM